MLNGIYQKSNDILNIVVNQFITKTHTYYDNLYLK
jgi:hypothetical protein